MKITTRGRYALRATLALAKLGGQDGTSVPVSTLSEVENISSIFLEQIFFKLRKAGIVTSVRGPGGGFCFARPLDELTVREILEAAGEDLDFVSCDKQTEDCDRLGFCLAHSVWSEVTRLVNDYFSSVTLAEIIAKNKISGLAGSSAGSRRAEELDDGSIGA
ncbi:MAG: Rrf2 family transcriptional regulator [Spirochaetaceae bacterium]|jgi:Rrf2 family iron-sulfur cluster assembly transcriptional regulator|nr:Rrf2 family transcriptional regulator [Spirochaetaceae bacterium]